jgi:cytochrome c peroxidase
MKIRPVWALVCLGAGCAVDPHLDDLAREAAPLDPTSEVAPPGLVTKVRTLAAEAGVGPLPPAPDVRPALYELGRVLAFDKVLSGNGDIACMTCHHPTLGTGDGRHLSIGQGASGLGPARVHPAGDFIARNAPPLYNLHDLDRLFWDGRVAVTATGAVVTPAGGRLTGQMAATFEHGALSAQAMFPVLSPEEMRGWPGDNPLADLPGDDLSGIWAGLMARLGEIPAYPPLFEAAYPGVPFAEMTFAHAANAIAGFQVAAFEMRDSPWDRFLAGDDQALTIPQLRGAEVFFRKGGCVPCHRGASFTDGRFFGTALAQLGPGLGDGPGGRDDFGRARVTQLAGDRYRFRTTPLRNVALTGPWGHAGQFVDLRAFVAHYDDPVAQLAAWDPGQLEEALRDTVVDNFDDLVAGMSGLMLPVKMNNQEIDFVVAYLHALTDPRALDQADLVPAAVPSGLPVD